MLQNIIELAGCLEIRKQLSPVLLDNIIAYVVDEVPHEMKHALRERVAAEKHTMHVVLLQRLLE